MDEINGGVVVWDLDDTIVPWAMNPGALDVCASQRLSSFSDDQLTWIKEVVGFMLRTEDRFHHVVVSAGTVEHVNETIGHLRVPVRFAIADARDKHSCYRRNFPTLKCAIAVGDQRGDMVAARAMGWTAFQVDPTDIESLRRTLDALFIKYYHGP
jgi:hypothetical protein